MKFKSLVKATLATASVVALSACGASTSNNSSKAEETKSSNGSQQAETKKDIVTEVKSETTITFWHAMNGQLEKALQKLTEDFMKANPNIKVELQNQSTYKDLQAKINSTLTSPKDLPTITQAYPNWLFNAASQDSLVDFKPYIENEKIGFKKGEKIRSDLMEGARINGVQYGIPFNKSTEVLFYNADLLKEYGVKVPTTLDELKEAAKTIYEKSNHEVVGAGFDSLNNYYAIGMKNKGVDFTKELDFTSAASKEVVKYYADGIRDGYFRTAGSDKYLSGPFQNKKVAMYVGSTAGESFVAKGAKEAGYEYGVAPRPDKFNLQQGTDIYMFEGSTTEEQRTAAFLYLKFLSSAESQLYWAQKTGYMPTVASVLEKDEYKKSGSKVPAILADATKNLFSIPVVENSDPAYAEVRTILEKIFATQNGNVDQLIQDSKAQFDAAWNQ